MKTSATAIYEGRRLANPAEDIFDQGLAFDLETLIGRRQVLKLLGSATIGVGVLGLAACLPAGSSGTASGSAANADCDVIPEETAGPYPGDGSNGPDVLNHSGIVRSDIRTSFGGASGVATGVPLTIQLLVQDQANSCGPLANAAVYLWHCDQAGRYSLYSGVTSENYLRGVQAAGSDGVVTFQSVFPACYSGRWPHIHFEVYRSLDEATDQANKIATSQIALPKDVCDAVYGTGGYEQSVQNLGQVSLDSDMVFGEDGGVRQLGTMSGSVDAGYQVELAVPVAT